MHAALTALVLTVLYAAVAFVDPQLAATDQVVIFYLLSLGVLLGLQKVRRGRG